MFLPQKRNRTNTKGHKETPGGVGTSITLIRVLVLWVFACVQTHQIVHSKYVKFFVY